MPPSRCSSSSNSRPERSSRSRSASFFLICHHFTSVLLGGRPHDARHSFGHEKCPQDGLVQPVLKKTGAVLFRVCYGRQPTLNGDDGRHSTITLSSRTTERWSPDNP